MSNVSRQIDERDQWLFNASTNDLVGVKNPTGRGDDLLPVRLDSTGTSLVSGDRNYGFGSNIIGVSKIRKLLGAIGNAAYRRVNIGMQAHSIGVGVNSTETATFDAATFTNYHTKSQAAIIAKRLSAAVGGTACCASIVAGGISNLPNPLLTTGGSAPTPLQDGLFGVGAWNAVLSAPGHTLSFTAVGTSIRVYSVNSGAGSVIPGRWSAPSVSGGATQTAAAPSGGNTPDGARTFNNFTVGPVVPGETVSLIGPTSGSYRVHYIDLDYQPSAAGVSVHRLCVSGLSLPAINAAALDSTDTQGPQSSSWIGSAAAKVNARLGQAQTVSVQVPQDGVILQTDVNDLNDWTAYGYTLADLSRHLTNYLTYKASLGIPVLVILGPIRDPSYLPGTRPYDQADIIAAYKTVIDASSNAAYIDLTAEFSGSTLTARYDAQTASALLYDIVHPGTMGHGYYGLMIADALLAAAANR